MGRVTQIDGAPGGGKTTTLKQKLREETNGGLEYDRFYWLSFTNAGRKDAELEIADVYAEADESSEARARTLHSLSLSLMIREGVISPKAVDDVIISPNGEAQQYYRDFSERQGMQFDSAYSDPRKLLSGGKITDYTGNLLFAINDYLTQTCKSPEKWRSAPVDIPIPGESVVELLEEWDEYKRERFELRLFEHGDYVAEAFERGLIPDIDVLLVDEFQDLAPVEYRLFKLWRDSGQLDRVYIAGDPNQAIYSFRGGTPYYFEETAVDERINLRTSRRCRQEIARLGNAVLSAHPDTDPRGFSGTDSGGKVLWRSLSDGHDLRRDIIDVTDRYANHDPSILLLTRTNAQLRQLTNELKDVGIPFDILGTYGGVWRGDLRQMLTFLNNLKSDSTTFAWSNAQKIIEHLPNATERRRVVTNQFGGFVDRDGIVPALDGLESPIDVVNHLKIPVWKRDVLKNAVDAPASIQTKEVRAGTIHTAKGLEAPAVYLFTETTDRAVQRYGRDSSHAAEEHRVYYVGLTRASHELHLISGYFDGPTAPPIEKIRRHSEA